MKRRLFLHFPLVAASLTLNAQNKIEDRPSKPFKVEAGKDRFDSEIAFMGGSFDLKVSAKDTDGDLYVYDTIRTSKGGPPLHLHHSQDEWFYVLDGEFLFKIGEENFNLKAGDSIFWATQNSACFCQDKRRKCEAHDHLSTGGYHGGFL